MKAVLHLLRVLWHLLRSEESSISSGSYGPIFARQVVRILIHEIVDYIFRTLWKQ